MTDICPVCGENFGREVRGRPKVYCSDNCRVRAHRSRHSQTVTITISREDFKRWAKRLLLKGPNADLDNRMIDTCRATLEEK